MRRTWGSIAVPLVLASAVISAATLVPVKYDSKDALFEIPKGTWARRMAGNKLDILPAEIHMIAGTNLVLRNLDTVPQIFGPTLIMPDQALRLPFESPAEYQFACTAHVNGQLSVVVTEAPTSALARLRWHARMISDKFSRLWRGA
jgi:hypothetical protein